MAGDEIEIIVECCVNQDEHQLSTSPELAGGQGLHGWADHGSNVQRGRPVVPDPPIPHSRYPVVRFRKIEGDAVTAAVQPGAWHRLQLAAIARGGGSRNNSLATIQTLRFFAELGNGATARLLVGE